MASPRAAWRIAAAVLAAGMLAALLNAVMTARRSTPAIDGTGPGVALPAADIYGLELPDADGHPVALAQWKGRRVVLNFWATWCAPCVAEMPDLDQAQAEAGDAVIVGVGTEDLAHVREFRDRLGLHLPLLAGGYDALVLARTLGDAQGVLPYTVLLSPDGHLLRTQVGALRTGQLHEWLQSGH